MVHEFRNLEKSAGIQLRSRLRMFLYGLVLLFVLLCSACSCSQTESEWQYRSAYATGYGTNNFLLRETYFFIFDPLQRDIENRPLYDSLMRTCREGSVLLLDSIDHKSNFAPSISLILGKDDYWYYAGAVRRPGSLDSLLKTEYIRIDSSRSTAAQIHYQVRISTADSALIQGYIGSPYTYRTPLEIMPVRPPPGELPPKRVDVVQAEDATAAPKEEPIIENRDLLLSLKTNGVGRKACIAYLSGVPVSDSSSADSTALFRRKWLFYANAMSGITQIKTKVAPGLYTLVAYVLGERIRMYRGSPFWVRPESDTATSVVLELRE